MSKITNGSLTGSGTGCLIAHYVNCSPSLTVYICANTDGIHSTFKFIKLTRTTINKAAVENKLTSDTETMN